MGTVIDGKAIAAEIQCGIKAFVHKLSGRPPCVAVILVGTHGPSSVYVNRKVRACKEVGITSIRHDFPADLSQEKLLGAIEKLNRDPAVDGILVQLPLPPHISVRTVLYSISPEKDVDGFHPSNVGKAILGDPEAFIPCTPLGIKVILEKTGIRTSGRHAVILGRSNLVGRPLSCLLSANAPGGNATVTLLHSRSNAIEHITRQADILFACMGQPGFVTENMIKKGAVVIDIGITKIADPTDPKGGQLKGDVDFQNVREKCSFITPVPGGVGPMTIAMLLANTIQSYKARFKL